MPLSREIRSMGRACTTSSVSNDGFVGWIFEGNVGVGQAGWAGVINRANSHAASTQEELSMFYGSIRGASVFRDITKG
jgi:hypothetical protein